MKIGIFRRIWYFLERFLWTLLSKIRYLVLAFLIVGHRYRLDLAGNVEVNWPAAFLYFRNLNALTASGPLPISHSILAPYMRGMDMVRSSANVWGPA